MSDEDRLAKAVDDVGLLLSELERLTAENTLLRKRVEHCMMPAYCRGIIPFPKPKPLNYEHIAAQYAERTGLPLELLLAERDKSD
jgi:hypothetical protein